MHEPLPRPALVIGAGGGLGAAFVAELNVRGVATQGLSRRKDGVDLTDEPAIARAVGELTEAPRLVLVATGLLHGEGVVPEKSLAALDAATLAHAFAVNAIGPALLMKHLLPRMPRRGRSVFAVLSARVGSIGDNRLGGWYSYRASKAALNQLVRTAAIEQRRRSADGIVVALHPGTVATALSEPFRGGATRVFTPREAAVRLLEVVERLQPSDSGGFFAWDGTAVPF